MFGIGHRSLGVGGKHNFTLTICSCSAITSLQHSQDRIPNTQSPQKEHCSLSFKKISRSYLHQLFPSGGTESDVFRDKLFDIGIGQFVVRYDFAHHRQPK